MSARLPEAAEESPTAELLRARRGAELSTLDRLLLHSPRVAEGWNALLGALRAATTLSADPRELVVLLSRCGATPTSSGSRTSRSPAVPG